MSAFTEETHQISVADEKDSRDLFCPDFAEETLKKALASAI